MRSRLGKVCRFVLGLVVAGFVGHIHAQVGERFRAIEYEDVGRWVPNGPTPESVCAAHARVWGWDVSPYSFAISGLTASGWKCQRFNAGAPEPAVFTYIYPRCQTASAAPIYPGAPWAGPTGDPGNDSCYCPAAFPRFDRGVQWCVAGGTTPTDPFQPDRDNTCPTPNPVHPGSGNKVSHAVDAESVDLGVLRRSYSYRSNTSSELIPVGPGWGLRLAALLELPIPGLTDEVKVRTTDGGVNRFRLIGGGWTSVAGTQDRLEETFSGGVRSGWRYYEAAANTLTVYAASGRPLKIVSATGATIDFIYGDATTPATVAYWGGSLIRIQSWTGRRIEFASDAVGVTRAALPGTDLGGTAGTPGGPIEYRYSEGASLGAGVIAAGQLTSVRYPDGHVLRYHYEDSRFPVALTGISHDVVRHSAYAYDIQGRATSTVQFATPGSPVAQWTLSYPAGGSTGVTRANGASTTVSSTHQNGVNLQTGSSQPAGSGCAASVMQQSFDAAGNATSRDDFNGNRSCFAYDSRNLMTTRVEGLLGGASGAVCSSVVPSGSALPVGSRKTSYSWHPHWRLETNRAEPGRVATSVYNGQPDPFSGGALASCAPAAALLPDGRPIAVLCKQVERATTDQNGSLGFGAAIDTTVPARVWVWTYNATGQVLSATDPSGAVTTSAYYTSTNADHTIGDLQATINAAGHVTQFTRYNAQGLVLESVAPNGTVTQHTYDGRQRRLTTTVGTETTSYTYNLVGQLVRVTLPDGSFLATEFDGAQRVTAIYDGAGNRIEYTLDAEGQRIGESAKDPTGTLRRTLTRSFDALNRVQQINGRE